MSQRTHFWLRIVGLVVILALGFGPHVRTGPAAITAPARLAAASNAR
jgi:hypothetical protein